jgi:hypothetical protein
MESFIRDLRVAVRGLTRQPSFSILAIFTLGLGIGGSTAIFSVIDAALLRPLPYPAPEQMVDILVEQQIGERQRLVAPSVEDVEGWQRDGTVLSHVAMWTTQARILVDGPQLERLNAFVISEDYLGVYGVVPLLGRGIERADTLEGASPVVLIGYDYWQTRFGGEKDVIGRVISVEHAPATIVGVLPPTFNPTCSRSWLPCRWRPACSSGFTRR